MSFEIFKQVGVNTKIYISVASSKSFGFPRTFLDKYGITDNHKVVIMYDESTKRVALHFSTESVRYGLKIQVPNKKHGGSINAKSFFDVKGIDATEYAGRYDKFENVPLSDLGVSAPGSAFVFTLEKQGGMENSSTSTPAPAEGGTM